MLSEQLLIPGQVAIRVGMFSTRYLSSTKQKYFVIGGLRLTFDLPTAPKIKNRDFEPDSAVLIWGVVKLSATSDHLPYLCLPDS